MMISVKTFMHQKQTLAKISGPEIIFAERHTPEPPPPSTPHLSSEAEFLDVIGTKVLRVFPLAIHSHLY